ncbi:MAG: hypothetical protein AAGI34_18440 [Pseudomonadota bacterium]
MTTQDTESFDWNMDYAARRLALAFDLAFPGGVANSHMLRLAWHSACRELRYLEMMVRRLLVFLAGSIKLNDENPVRRAGKRMPKDTAKHADRSAGFALNETLATYEEILAMAHGTSRAPASAAYREPQALHPVVSAERIAARFAALARVLEAPDHYARLYARRFWRGGKRVGTLSIKLVHWKRPALARSGTLDLATSAYMEAVRLCFVVLNRPP